MIKDEAYQILSDLIFKGFLTMDLYLEDKMIVLKTVNEKEFDMVKVYTGSSVKENILTFNMYFLIYSLLMIDGENILHNRDRKIPVLRKFLLDLPSQLTGQMVSKLGEMRAKAYEAVNYLEGFTYTENSRRQWKTIGGVFPNKEEFTGITGTSSMGLNTHQENWIYINRVLDQNEQYDQDFSMAVLVASATNPKGSKQIRDKHDANMKAGEDRRKKLAKVGYLDTSEWSEDGWSVPVETAESLLAELDRQMAGVKDKHDVFMENYLKSMKDHAERASRLAEEKIEKYRAEHDTDDPARITGSQRALTSEETEQLMSKKSNSSHLITVSDEEEGPASSGDQDRIMKKVGKRVLTSRN